MAKDGIPYTGFLYAGLMIDARRATRKVLEFNCRLGDPETQPILLRLKSDLLRAARARRSTASSTAIEAEWDRRVALGVVLAAAGYPETPRKGDAITGIPPRARTDCHVFHAGTALQDGKRRHQRRPRAVRHRARRQRPDGAAARLRSGRRRSSSPACSCVATSGIRAIAPARKG